MAVFFFFAKSWTNHSELENHWMPRKYSLQNSWFTWLSVLSQFILLLAQRVAASMWIVYTLHLVLGYLQCEPHFWTVQEVVCQSIYKSNQLVLVGFVVVVPMVIIEMISVCRFSCTMPICEFCSLVSYLYQSAGFAFLKSMAVSSMSVEGFC